MSLKYLFGSLLVCSLLLISFSFGVCEEELSLSAKVDKTKIEVGETFVFTVTISGDYRTVPNLDLPEFKEKEFELTSRNDSYKFNLKSGKIHSVNEFNCTLRASSSGKHTIGSAQVNYKGRVYKTEPIEVEVVSQPGELIPPKKERDLRFKGGTVL